MFSAGEWRDDASGLIGYLWGINQSRRARVQPQSTEPSQEAGSWRSWRCRSLSSVRSCFPKGVRLTTRARKQTKLGWCPKHKARIRQEHEGLQDHGTGASVPWFLQIRIASTNPIRRTNWRSRKAAHHWKRVRGKLPAGAREHPEENGIIGEANIALGRNRE